MSSVLSGVNWRETMKPARILGVDGRAVFPLLLFAVHLAVWTALIALASMSLFVVLERRGLTPPAAFRSVRSWLAGPIRHATPKYKKRKMISYLR